MTRLHAVVLAGGGGSRLWPISRRRRPKQVLRLSAERSLFAESIARLTSWLPVEQITVATTPVLAGVLAQEVPDLPVRSRFGAHRGPIARRISERARLSRDLAVPTGIPIVVAASSTVIPR